MQTINWGIIGCGDVTEVKSGPAYQLTEGFNIKAIKYNLKINGK